MTFADISIVPVPRERRAAYLAFARRMAEVYREHGATRVTGYWQADEPTDPNEFHAAGADYAPGELRGLADLAGATDAEAVAVTITEWPSRQARDHGTAAATGDPRVRATLGEEPVFDGRRLVADRFEQALRLPADDRDGAADPVRRDRCCE